MSRKKKAHRTAATARRANPKQLPNTPDSTDSGDPVQCLLDRLQGVRGAGDGKWMAFCPVHEDPPDGHRRSLSVKRGDDGRALVHCHAGCTTDHVVDALGLRMADLMSASKDKRAGRPNKQQTQAEARAPASFATAAEAVAAAGRNWGKPSTQWTYHDAQGEPIGVVARWNTSDGKTIRPVSRNGDGWRVCAMDAPRPLYCLPELADAERVYVLEGEKCAEAARNAGLVATTSVGGSKGSHKSNWTPLAGKDVVILPDKDDAGRKYAEKVAQKLLKLQPPARVRILELPDLEEGEDFADWVGPDGAMGDKGEEEIRQRVEALVADTPDWTPPIPTVTGAGDYESFPVDTLPEPFRSFVTSAAQAMVCPPSYVALPLLAAAASAVGNTRRIRVKDGWTEPAVIWTVIIGEPGTVKSPAMEKALAPLKQIQQRAFVKYEEQREQYEIEKEKYEKEKAAFRRNKRSEPPEKPKEPKPVRYICQDATVEALAVMLADNPKGVLLARDELNGWLNSFGEYKKQASSDASKFLEMHRAGHLLIDRKTGDRKTINVPRAAVSITGGIQPGTLRRSLGREYFDNGLASRLLMAYPPRQRRPWTEKTVDSNAKAEVAKVFERLITLEPVTSSEEDQPEPGLARMDGEAKAAWVQFYIEHEREQQALHGDLAAAWSKLQGYVARFALVIHLIRWAAGECVDPETVNPEDVGPAVRLVRWFGREIKRIYALMAESEEELEERQLLELLHGKGGAATVRELMRWAPDQYRTAELAEQALSGLVEAGFGRWEDVPPGEKGGRPTKRFRLFDAVGDDETA